MEGKRKWWKSGMAAVLGIAAATVLVHLAVGWRYGFDRDELMALEDARHLAWGYVQYPPMTAFFGWVALKLFGTSLGGFRFFAALVQALALLLVGMMAEELGGEKWAQTTAALAGVPFCLGAGALMQYISFDYVCWVVVAWGMVKVAAEEVNLRFRSRLARGEWLGASENTAAAERRNTKFETRNTTEGGVWWVVVGAGIGLGMLAKYTMGLLVAGVVVGVLATPLRRHLRSGWLWAGVALSLAIFFPNFLWEWRHGFVSADFLRFLHERDVREGVTKGFLVGQLEVTMLATPLAAVGLWFCFGREEGKPYRVLGWMYVVPLALLVVFQGREYYLAPAYPLLYAAGAVWVERKWRIENGKNIGAKRWLRRGIWVALAVDVVVAAGVALPIAPVNSRWWKMAAKVDTVFPEEIGWEEFTQSVAEVWGRLPESERVRAAILAGNYGEIGALNLYGERLGLPRAISGVDSSWERGYGAYVPETLVVVGYPRELLENYFASCEVGGRVWNKYGVANEETVEDPEIFVCRGRKGNWEEFWKAVRKYA